MKARQQLILLLLLSGLTLALLPLTGNRSFRGQPAELLREVLDEQTAFTADQVAEFVAREREDVQLFDLREPGEFSKGFIPGAVNVPYAGLISSDPDMWLRDSTTRKVFYSSDESEAAWAMTWARGLGYSNTFYMKGSLEEWVEAVSDTRFSGEKITARENALLEVRKRAGELYNELLSLPDSLKAGYLDSRKFSARKLDGGC